MRVQSQARRHVWRLDKQDLLFFSMGSNNECQVNTWEYGPLTRAGCGGWPADWGLGWGPLQDVWHGGRSGTDSTPLGSGLEVPSKAALPPRPFDGLED